jgi:phosphoribosyl 1,2-cyclic phosphodiesterase
MMEGMKVRLWGVRGSICAPGKKFSKMGGNTSCVEVRCGDSVIILDAGTGIRMFGDSLLAENPAPKDIHILVTHTHWDHIQGFPFFEPAYRKGYNVTLYGGHSVSTLERLIMGQMDREYVPITLPELSADVKFVHLKKTPFMIGDVSVSFTHLLHPGLALGYRIDYKGRSFAYIADNEVISEPLMEQYNWENIGSLIHDADLVAADCQYTLGEYRKKVGWGHSAIELVVELCREYGVKKLLAYHHDPRHDDRFVASMVRTAKKKAGRDLKVVAAREGDEYFLQKI